MGSRRDLSEPYVTAHISYLRLAAIFLRLGFTAFGGPAAHIGMMQREFVERRGWITKERFLDMLGVVNLIPGPNSTELAISIGAELGGRRGLLIAGACFIAPAFAIVLLLAWLYMAYGTLPDVGAILGGVKPVALAIIAQVIWKLGEGMIAKPTMIVIALLVFGIAFTGLHELPLLLGSGILGMLIGRMQRKSDGEDDDAPRDTASASSSGKWSPRRLWFYGGGILGGIFGAPTLGSIFLYFLYLGSVLYGSGYVLVAFLRGDLVGPGSLGWLSERQLLDAVAIGQVTPGPLFTTATFIGYILHGVPGSLAATAGIFLPSFLFVLLTHRWIARLRSHPSAASFLDGVNAGALGLIAIALISLGQGTLTTAVSWGIALAALALLLTTRINPTWLIVAGGIMGWLAEKV